MAPCIGMRAPERMAGACLHGLLVKIRDLELPLIAVIPGRTLEGDGTGSRDMLDERNHLDVNG